MICSKADSRSAEKAAACLREGGIAILPTDTVYGFSAIVDLRDSSRHFKADEIIRSIKGRSEDKPFIQLLARPEDIFLYTDDVIPSSLLAKWPGPLTIIVRLKESAPLLQHGATVAFRCPGDVWLRTVLAACNAPLYSTSVNRSGKNVLSRIADIRAEFESEVQLIVDDGDKEGALPSTIVSVQDGKISVLRQGAVTI